MPLTVENPTAPSVLPRPAAPSAMPRPTHTMGQRSLRSLRRRLSGPGERDPLCLLGVTAGCAVWLSLAFVAADAVVMLREEGQQGLAAVAFAVQMVGVAACAVTALVGALVTAAIGERLRA